MPLTVWYEGRRLVLDAPGPDRKPRSLARLLWLEGPLPPRSLCGGLGRCGRCRVRFRSAPPPAAPSETRALSAAELAHGVRLACLHQARDGMDIEVDSEMDEVEAGAHAEAAAVSPLPRPACPAPDPGRTAGCSPKAGLHLAVDFGTTTVAWQAEDDAGNILAAGESPNPQRAAGADVMARLAEGATPAGARRMRRLALDFVNDIVDNLAHSGREVRDVCLAANPAMTALALGRDASGLRAAPYRLDDAGDREERPEALPPFWIPPQLGPFVGGDVSAGLAAMLDEPRPLLLADMGTNGEFVLLRPSRAEAGPAGPQADPPLLAASVPLGPALEGVGLRCGGPAGPGGVTAFHAGPAGLMAVTLDDGDGGDKASPRHICGTGYLSLIRLLLRLGLLDADGRFRPDAPPGPGPLEFLRARLAASLRPDAAPGSTGETLLPLPGDLFLSAGDVEAVLQVKAAFSLAVERLLNEGGLTPAALRRIRLAGSLGRHAPLDALEDLGFLPPGAAARARPAGNASLAGAALLLREPGRDALRRRLRRTIAARRVLDLAAEPDFQQDFIRHMRFGHTQRTL